MSTDNGGPAFPSHGSMGEVAHEGMTLRDYFAAKAMQGFAADPEMDSVGCDRIAEWAYEWADSMLRARKETK